MNIESFLNKVKKNSTGVLGGVIGAIVGILILNYGLFKVLFIVITTAIGVFVGNVMKHSKGWFKRLIEKIFPPGRYR